MHKHHYIFHKFWSICTINFTIYTNVTLCEFVCVEAIRLSQQIFSYVRMEPTLPGFNQFCRELMCLAQGHNTVTPVGIKLRTSRFRV